MVEYFKTSSLPQSTRDDDESTTTKKTTFIQPVSESDVTKGQSSLATPTTTKEVESLEKTRKRRKSRSKSRTTPTFVQPVSESDVTKGQSSLATPTTTKEVESLEKTRAITTARKREQQINISELKTETQRAPRTQQAGETTRTDLGKTLKPSDLGFYEQPPELTLEIADSKQLREGRKQQLREDILSQDPTEFQLKDALLLPEVGFDVTKEVVTGAVQSLDPVAATEGAVTLAAGLITGEQDIKDIPGQVSEAFIEDPTTFIGGVAAAVVIPELAARVAPAKTTVVSQKGKITTTQSSALQEGTTLIDSTDILKIRRGRKDITAVVEGKGTVVTEIDDILLGTTKRDITFFDESGKPIGTAVERADFNIRELEIIDPKTKKPTTEIRAEGTTATVGESGNIVSGKFQSTKQPLPDESFFNRLVGGTEKTKIKGDPTDLNIKTGLPTPKKATTETLGFQKQQFEITSIEDVSLELAPGIKVSKEATITKTTDLTAAEGVGGIKSQFEVDFLQRTPTKQTDILPTTKSDPLLGPIIVQDDAALFAQSPLTKTKPKPADVSITPSQPQTVTVTKTKTSQKITSTQLPTSQILDVLPPQQTAPFFPTAITTSSAKGPTTKPRVESPSQVSISEGVSLGPGITDLSREFAPPKETVIPDNVAIVTPVVVPSITPSPTKQKGRSRSGSKTRQEPILDVIQEPVIDTTTKQRGRAASRQLTKQQTGLATTQTAIQRTGLFGGSLIPPVAAPTTIPKVRPKLKSTDLFTVVIGKEANVVFKEIGAGSLEEAAQLGFAETKKTAAASFQVFKGETAVDIDIIPGFTKSKKDKTRVVQKKETRISSLGELEGITELGIAASKKRKKSSKKKKKTNDIFDIDIGGLF